MLWVNIFLCFKSILYLMHLKVLKIISIPKTESMSYSTYSKIFLNLMEFFLISFFEAMLLLLIEKLYF